MKYIISLSKPDEQITQSRYLTWVHYLKPTDNRTLAAEFSNKEEAENYAKNMNNSAPWRNRKWILEEIL